MAGGKQLLLLAAFLPLIRCQQTPTVSMLPDLKQVFPGDLLFLTCSGSSTGEVTWYLNDKVLKSKDKTLKIAAAEPKDSGSYSCEINGKRSANLSLTVLEYAPSASLTIKTGHPVMRTQMSVILKLENDEGLKGWVCRVKRNEVIKKIKLKVNDNPVSLSFQPKQLNVMETVFWCFNEMGESRSNQVIIRTSDKRVSMEMYPLPAVAGESLTLKCLVWGTNKISQSVFYKGNSVFETVQGSESHKIQTMTESEVGSYKCEATYKYVDQTVSNSHTDTSDTQDVPVYASPVRAELSDNMGCSCSRCDSSMLFRYYKKTEDSWKMLDSNESLDSSGTYRCRAVMHNMRTLPSRSVTKPLYEDVRQKRHGDNKEPEYDTIQLEAAGGRERKGGEYEALKKEDMKEGEYHTVGVEGASGGDGGYQELKKGQKEEVYHTVGDHVAAGPDGGYEALKREKCRSKIMKP
ncbi:uncharacterized protein LOC108237157 isoform X2 [Kryptolebias marmoratus]|uniref:Uncharacterized LOC108237157 n=1 Tax=Kryptolebias marmoratus TaxID=37003 RepID=A0A3Q3ADN0_KRYMA|nr:uncharacterized protein LOC108237157 isoform X2 [Kryptolebias marmoratus]